MPVCLQDGGELDGDPGEVGRHGAGGVAGVEHAQQLEVRQTEVAGEVDGGDGEVEAEGAVGQLLVPHQLHPGELQSAQAVQLQLTGHDVPPAPRYSRAQPSDSLDQAALVDMLARGEKLQRVELLQLGGVPQPPYHRVLPHLHTAT